MSVAVYIKVNDYRQIHNRNWFIINLNNFPNTLLLKLKQKQPCSRFELGSSSSLLTITIKYKLTKTGINH